VLTRVELPYGDTPVFLDGRPLTARAPAPAPGAVERAVEAAAGSVAPGPGLVFIVPDRTRDARIDALLPALVERLDARGAPCVFASGTHAPMGDDEMTAALGAAAGLVSPVAHDCDRSALVELAGGARINAVVAGARALVVLSEIRFHYLAGFGGGRKMIAPGCSDRATATRVHARCLTGGAPASITAGVLEGNPLDDEIRAITRGLPPAVGVCVARDGADIVDAEGGELWAHHARLAARFGAAHTVVAESPVRRLALSAGGGPHEVNLVQAHKALRAVAPILEDGARVALLARCPRGLGHPAFARWAARPLDEQLAALGRAFVIGQQTAWSWSALCARLEVGLVSELDDEVCRAVGARPLARDEIEAFLGPSPACAPEGAARRYVTGA
jgi:nickel-dependent lactate racemase